MIRRTFTLMGIASVALIGCGEATVEPVSFVTDQSFVATVPAGTMDRCEFDDGTGAPCVWVAPEQGEDGDGASFVVLESYEGPFAYVTHDQARTLSK